jgi:hypothetical protein
MEFKMIDKRQQRRFFKRYRAEFSAHNRTYRGITVNFSLNGLFIRTSNPLSRDTSLDIAVHLPDGSTSRLQGKVARIYKTFSPDDVEIPYRISNDGMGVTVTQKDASFLHLIRSLLTDKTRRDDRLDTWVWQGLKSDVFKAAPGEFEAFAREMQRKLGAGCNDLPGETDHLSHSEILFDELTYRQRQILDRLMTP